MTSPQTSEATQTGVVLTDAAAEKAKTLLEQEGRDDLRLRVAVQPGGCSGLSTSCSSTSAISRVTTSPTSAGSRSSWTG